MKDGHNKLFEYFCLHLDEKITIQTFEHKNIL